MELRKQVRLRVQRGRYGKSMSYTITLPKDFVEALEWKQGDKLEIILDTEKREIRVRR